MANGLFDHGRESFLRGEISWSGDNIKAVMVDHAVDTPNRATDQFLSDIAAGARVSTSGNLVNKTTTAGVADADDTLFSLVSGATVESIVFYQDTGSAATSRLIGQVDTLGVGTFPITPNGGDILITWDNGSDKIFKL